ncbi:NAD(P)-dependent oxidoreductase [Gloeobacter violaceus]|uniref:Glr3759 protein n=1 Tax=Gloeobacter violaceus (strain ATCC 29082 / PCC 7421) TaxID=251221 RepID=Q7NEW9_GLOVI|nr:NAD(P)-dependent oxidoreductase [Gloeobacter violaceus]BAC91700.1 glr3759 [Gloeobacter violaceus PCC 7421]
MSKAAVLGMGAMGSRMAAALLKAGHQVTVWNRNSQKTAPLAEMGAKAAQTPRAAVEEVDFAVCMVRDDAASRFVWLDFETGALAGLPADAVAIESSTLSVAGVQELAEHFQARGKTLLDAPVSGSRPQAEAGQLIFLVGGDAGAVAKAGPILNAMGGTVHHAGPLGNGAAVKLAINALLGVQVAAMGELIALLRHCGIDEVRAVEIIGSTSVCSPAARGAASAMAVGNYAPLFPSALMEKDLGYLQNMAAAHRARAPLTQAARSVFGEAMSRGYGEDNMTGVAQLYWQGP